VLGKARLQDSLYTIACRRRIYKLLQTRINTIFIDRHSTLFEITIIEIIYIRDKKVSARKIIFNSLLSITS
jgi:hypothetical protein